MPSHQDESAALAIQTPADQRPLARGRTGLCHGKPGLRDFVRHRHRPVARQGPGRGARAVFHHSEARPEGGRLELHRGCLQLPGPQGLQARGRPALRGRGQPGHPDSAAGPRERRPAGPTARRSGHTRLGAGPEPVDLPARDHPVHQRDSVGPTVRSRGARTAFLLHRPARSAAQRPPAQGTARDHGSQGQMDPRRRFLEHPQLSELPA